MLDLPLPIEFRSEIIEPLLNSLRSGESCSLVGVGSSGKSNLTRHLARQDVREYYLGEAARSMLAAYADCAKLTDYTVQALHSLILEAVSNAVQESSLETATLRPKLESLWEQAAEATVPDKARRALEEAIASIQQAGITQIFVILDDFDHVVLNAPGPVLSSLRALRDNFETRLMYITVTRRELGFLRNENEYQDFHELVCSVTMPIGSYRESDARVMMDRLVLRWGLPPLSEVERQRLWEASGGHAGLLKAILWITRREKRVDLMSPNFVKELCGKKGVRSECEKIWESLEEEEKRELQAVVGQWESPGKVRRRSERKGLLSPRQLDGTYDIFSPVFADFVRDPLPARQDTRQPLTYRLIRTLGHPFGLRWVGDNELAVIYEMERYHSVRGPGFFWVNPWTQTVHSVIRVAPDFISTYIRGIRTKDGLVLEFLLQY